ncbi:hypothetical protein [Neorhizobium galegae]|uniref:Secreted protein n=1 Tax=Neorhizobium galegae bv. officinalis TaxID=323656 RepID=A0A0T7GWH5_NEOGA|nr:hypothetical protein [Neorhizobium galegae]CDZ51622.1 Hypothetical protein NGAL_HAMBI1189_40730 [Neorhizobium galegae bv. officinalis]
MKMRLRQFRAIAMLMSLLVIVNLAAVASAAAKVREVCPETVVSATGEHSKLPEVHHGRGVAGDCCSGMHCCPIVPHLQYADIGPRTRVLPSPLLDDDTPLLLVRAIDPPPRSGNV